MSGASDTLALDWLISVDDHILEPPNLWVDRGAAKDRDKASGEAKKIAQKLANADFVRRAPEEVVDENRERLATMQAEIARLEAALQRIE